MKSDTHPEIYPTVFTCACGNSYTIGSTMKEPQRMDICAKCHPFFTGKEKLVDTAGRIDKFNRRYGKASS